MKPAFLAALWLAPVQVSQEIKAPIAIIKCAAGGTTLGGDWNPADPSGFKLYPLADYIPTSHGAVEIGGGEGLHDHYGTLGPLQHDVNYADANLQSTGGTACSKPPRTLVTDGMTELKSFKRKS